MSRVQRIEELKKELAKLELEEKEQHSPARRIATMLHGAECDHNHQDVCSWQYAAEKDDWTVPVRAEYLERAKNILKELDNFSLVNFADFLRPEDAVEIVEIVLRKGNN